jgi:hypothetical protein
MLGRASQQARTLLRLLRSQTKQKSCSTTAARDGGRLLEGRGQVGTSSQDSKFRPPPNSQIWACALEMLAWLMNAPAAGLAGDQGHDASAESQPAGRAAPVWQEGRTVDSAMPASIQLPPLLDPGLLGKFVLLRPSAHVAACGGARGGGSAPPSSARDGPAQAAIGRTLVERQSGLRQARRADPELANLRARGR